MTERGLAGERYRYMAVHAPEDALSGSFARALARSLVSDAFLADRQSPLSGPCSTHLDGGGLFAATDVRRENDQLRTLG